MTEMQNALGMLARLPLSLLKTPSGRYKFVGRVPAELAYAERDGSPLKPETMASLKGCSNPAMLAKSRSWATEAEARAAAAESGYAIQEPSN